MTAVDSSPSNLNSGERLAARLDSLQIFGVRPGLDCIRALQVALDHPQEAQPTVLVGGTNGKGSTAALLAAMTTAAGYRTGLYTSPHLESITERIAVNGVPISEDLLADDLDHILQTATEQGLQIPTHFEILTLAAWLHFRRCQVDLAILEVGLGGRLDATNACEPILSLITSLDFDHEAQLGNTLTSIAFEKAGILREGRPAISGFCDAERRLLLQPLARERGAKLKIADPRRVQIVNSPDALPQDLRLETECGSYRLSLPLAGEHQHSNLSVAVLAAEALRLFGFPRLDIESIEQGVARSRWPGRLEWVEVPDEGIGVRRILLDAAHNPAGAKALAHYLDQEALSELTLLFGALSDKDIRAMFEPLAVRAQRVLLTRPNLPRGADPILWADGLGEIEREPERALTRALERPGDVVICGSIYLVGELRQRLREIFGVPSAPRFYAVPESAGKTQGQSDGTPKR